MLNISYENIVLNISHIFKDIVYTYTHLLYVLFLMLPAIHCRCNCITQHKTNLENMQ